MIKADVAHDLAAEVGDGGEDSAVDYVTLQFAEPALHLIEPRRIRRREVELHIGMLLEEGLHEIRFVGGEIVQNDVAHG